jgi:tetratricopeptide (TPR) repeat protein
MFRGRRWTFWLVFATLTASAFGAWAVKERRFADSLAQARGLMDEGRFPEARRVLVALRSARPADAEVGYRLGACEHAAGEPRRALETWSATPAVGPWGLQVGLARTRTLAGDFGRFADAETILESLLESTPPGADRDNARRTLAELYFWQGRRADVVRLIEAAWLHTTDPVGDLRDHWKAENSPTLIDVVRSEVERAAASAPDDDRVWLAQASIASQTGRPADADAFLKRCLEARPEDPAVWRARLELARGRDDLEGARACLARLPASAFAEDARLDLQAWLARRAGDPAAERAALEKLVRTSPADIPALDRLAVLAAEAGDAERARELRRRKGAADAAKDRYRIILEETVAPDRFAELGGLAETLGRTFEARGWWVLREAYVPTDPAAARALAVLGRKPPAPETPPAGTLADLFAAAPGAVGPKTTTDPIAGASPGSKATAAAAVPRFRDDAEAVGLRFEYDNGRSRQRQIPETTAGGVGLLDYDGDGWMDVYAVQGGTFPPDPSRPHDGDRLFRNRGDGTFEDVSERSGIADMARGYGHGVAVGDVDGDGRPDLFVTRWRSYALYRNRGDGTFEDATTAHGLDGDRDWPTSAAFADFDNDGDLDLYVAHYLAWDAENPTLCPRVTVSSTDALSEPEQRYNYCTPRAFSALSDHLFRNDGGRFVDVSAEAGVVETEGRGLGVVTADVDDDGLVDIFVANDTTANFLWRNLGDMKFEEVALIAGVACNASGAYQAGMGTALGDLDGDGRPDLLVTNFYGESTTYFRNLGGGAFADQGAALNLTAPTRFLLGFGVATLDADADGRLDLAIANGHVNDDRPDYPYDMPSLLLIQDPDGRLVDVSQDAGPPWTVPRVSRGLATGDLDNDGRVDLLILPQKSPLGYFHNLSERGGSLTLALEGTASNRDAVGAVATVTVGGRRSRGWRFGGGSFVSASDPRLHFGVGSAERVDEVEIRWPSGRIDRHGPLEARRGYRIREGDPTPAAIPGPWRR